jgi:hypothetical protein
MVLDLTTPVAKVTWQERALTSVVAAVDVEDHDTLVDKATIVLDDANGVFASTVLPGHKVQVELGWGKETTLVFDGVVSSTTVDGAATGASTAASATRTVVVALDPAWMMHQEPVTEDHTGSLDAIVKKIAGRHATPIGKIVVEPAIEFPEDAPLRQHARTDLEFLQETAQRVRARAFVEVNDGKNQFYWMPAKKLLEADPIAKLHYCLGSQTLPEFTYRRVAALAAAPTTANIVDPDSGAARQTAGATPEADKALTVDQGRAGTLGKNDATARDVYESAVTAASTTPPTPRAPVQAVGLAANRAFADAATVPDPTTVKGLEGEGRMAGDVRMRAKSKVTIDGIAQWAEGDWYVTSVVHAFRAPGHDNGAIAPYECRFTATR